MTSVATGSWSPPAFPTSGSLRTWPGASAPGSAEPSACVQQRRRETVRGRRNLQTVDRLVEVLDERDQDRRGLAGEHERLNGCHLAAQALDGVDPVPVRRCDVLHGVEYAMSLRRKAIVNWLWCGGDVMVLAGG